MSANSTRGIKIQEGRELLWAEFRPNILGTGWSWKRQSKWWCWRHGIWRNSTWNSELLRVPVCLHGFSQKLTQQSGLLLLSFLKGKGNKSGMASKKLKQVSSYWSLITIAPGCKHPPAAAIRVQVSLHSTESIFIF